MCVHKIPEGAGLGPPGGLHLGRGGVGSARGVAGTGPPPSTRGSRTAWIAVRPMTFGDRWIGRVQVCHHPTILAMHCEGRGWAMAGDCNLKSKFLGRCIEIKPLGCLQVPRVRVPA